MQMLQYHRKIASGRKIGGVIRSLGNAKGHSFRVLHKVLFMPVQLYENEIMIWREKKSWIRAVQMDNLRGLLGVRRMNRVPNAWNRKLCGIVKRLRKLFSGAWPYFKNKE